MDLLRPPVRLRRVFRRPVRDPADRPERRPEEQETDERYSEYLKLGGPTLSLLGSR